MEGRGKCEWNIEKHNEGMTAATVTGKGLMTGQS